MALSFGYVQSEVLNGRLTRFIGPLAGPGRMIERIDNPVSQND